MNATNPIPAAANDTTSNNSSAVPNSQGLNDMFLKLLVAQLQHQSPLSPMDPTQFVGQLAQFSELSEITQINQLLQQNLPPGSASNPKPHTAPATAQPAPARNSDSAAVPAAMVSAAVSAAQAAIPKFNSPAASILNHQIQGVF